jgi:hypothetical protein
MVSLEVGRSDVEMGLYLKHRRSLTMAARTAGFIALFVLMAGSATAKQEDAKAVVGDTVLVQLSGEVAKKYAEQTETPLPPGKDLGLTISMAATIEQLCPDTCESRSPQSAVSRACC